MRAATLIALALLAGGIPTGGARACVYTAVTYMGGRPSDAEIRAQKQRDEATLIRARTIAADAAWRGGVDAPGRLAEMLVPNVRPIVIERSDCGPMNEIDFASDEAKPQDLLAGTPYSERAEEFLGILRGYPRSPGRACNADVRARFAAFLRRRLSPDELRGAFIFLDPRWTGGEGIVARMTDFAGRTRRPPLGWRGAGALQTDKIAQWLALAPAGRALKRAVDDFWAETGPLLGDTDRLCPVGVARWKAEQAQLVRQVAAADEEERAARAKR